MVAYNVAGWDATIAWATAFSLTSGYLIAGWNDGLTITLTGTLAGSAVFSQSFVVDTTSPTFVTFNHGLVDNVLFSGSGGTQNSAYVGIGGGPIFALDNLTLDRGAVPEPAAWALMLGGFGVTGAAMRRRRAGSVVFA